MARTVRIEALKQWAGRYVDRRLGLETAGRIQEDELGYDPAQRRGYEPSHWLALRTALPRAAVTDRDVFVDLGSGKGRVVLQAARRYPFKRVIGVELSDELTEVAAANLRISRDQLRCPHVELVTADASEWMPPDDLTIAYLYNPFRRQTFSRVMERLFEGVDRTGRPLRLIYLRPHEHERLMRTGRAVELPPPSRLRLRLAGIPLGWVRRYELRPED